MTTFFGSWLPARCFRAFMASARLGQISPLRTKSGPRIGTFAARSAPVRSVSSKLASLRVGPAGCYRQKRAPVRSIRQFGARVHQERTKTRILDLPKWLSFDDVAKRDPKLKAKLRSRSEHPEICGVCEGLCWSKVELSRGTSSEILVRRC